MSALSIQVPFPVFQDRDGQPLDNGYVWIGSANLYPITNAVPVFFDAALTIQATQPLRTLNGYISNSGTPAQVYVNAVNFSILVQDSKGTTIYNFPDGTGISPTAAGINYDPSINSLLYPGGIISIKSALDQITDDDTGASIIGFSASGIGAVARSVQSKMRDIISVKDFGAIGDASNDDTPAIQAAINSLTSASFTGGILLFPSGFYRVTSPLIITKGITVLGSGIGAASGTGNSGGTVIRSSVAAGDVFTVSSESGVVFNNFTIDSTVTKSANTSGIRLQGSGGAGSINRRSKITNVNIIGMYEGITWNTASDIVVQGCVIQDFTNIGIYLKQDGGTDAGQSLIEGCLIWDLNYGASQASIRYDKGGDLKIVGNKLLGSDYGFRMLLDDGPTGTLLFSSNSFEQQNVYCMSFGQAVINKDFANVVIVGNQFSVLSPINAQGAISITAGLSASWIYNVTIEGNVFNMGCTSAQPHISIQDGSGVMISNNVMTNLGNAGPTAISTGGNVSGAQVLDNNITGYPTGLYSAGIDVDTVIRDNNGLTFAQLMTAKNGSQIYVTDGTIVGVVPPATSYNFTVTGSGSGCLAMRMRGAWLSII